MASEKILGYVFARKDMAERSARDNKRDDRRESLAAELALWTQALHLAAPKKSGGMGYSDRMLREWFQQRGRDGAIGK